jgi:hypothetical protein
MPTSAEVRAAPSARAGKVAALLSFLVRLGPALTLAGACGANAPTYFPAPAILEGGEGDDLVGTVALTFRAPSASERQSLADLGTRLGNQEVPWLREDRIHVEVRYTVTNLSDEEGSFYLRVDGASEFVRYDQAAVEAAFEQGGEDPVTVSLIQTVPEFVGPGKIFQGIVREDDFHEASLDLDSLGRWESPFISVLLNRSEVDPGWPGCAKTTTCTGMEMVPTNLVRPALWEVTVHFLPSTQMRLEFLVRVRDDDQILWQDGDEAFAPEPETFMPVIMEMVGG